MRDLWGNVIEIKNPLETGKIFEKHIANILKEYDGCNIAEQVNIGNKFGNHKHIVDILVNRKIIISVKLQNVGGTAEEKVGYEMYVLNKSLFEKAFIICGGVGWTVFENLLDMSKLFPKETLIRYEDDKTLSFIKNEIK